MSNSEMTFGNRVRYYFTNFEFYRGQDRLPLGGDIFEKKVLWTISVYLLTSLGIFCRQICNFPKVSINLANVQWNVLVASFIFGLALLPFFIKQVNRIDSKPGLPQVLTAFGVGFFVDLASNAIIGFYLK
jgi:hypothetical protein